LCNVGNKKAAVLPEPVREWAIMLKPDIISGITFFLNWCGIFVSYVMNSLVYFL
jgi:hypothetical protein